MNLLTTWLELNAIKRFLSRFFKLFQRKPFLDETTKAWLFNVFAWALRSFGSDSFYDRTILVTPTTVHFPDKFNSPEELAICTFNRVRKYTGMENCSCSLVPQKPDISPFIAPFVAVENLPREPAGTFSRFTNSRDIVISYNPALVNQPQKLIATFAHELAHYAETQVPIQPPGGEQCLEPATDVLAVIMGFGIFLANSAFTFKQFNNTHTQGWSTQKQGYLTEREILYALGIFCILKQIDFSVAQKHLKRELHSWFKRVRNELGQQHDCIERLKAIARI